MTIRIKDWEKFQHFRDRKPPWIKLYRDILDDLEWHELDPKSAKVLVMLWLIASETEGVLPRSKELAFRLRISESSLESMICNLSHWLYRDDINVISPRCQDDSLERETERERETEGEARPPIKPSKQSQAKRRIPDDFSVSDSVRAWAGTKGYLQLDEHLDAFRRKAEAKGYTYVDWDKAFMEAIREDWAKLRGGSFGGAPAGEKPRFRKELGK